MATLLGTFTDNQGSPRSGTITFTPTTLRESQTHTGCLVGISSAKVTLNGSGSFSVTIEPGIYRVVVDLSGMRRISAKVSIPGGGAYSLNAMIAGYMPR